MTLTLGKLIELGMSLADDMLPEDEVKEFVNDAIAAINIEVDADFPFLDAMDDVFPIPEKWQRLLIVPFVKARIKEKDSSQFEWEVGYEQFFTNLRDFAAKYVIPEQYKETKNAHTESTIVANVPYGWGGW